MDNLLTSTQKKCIVWTVWTPSRPDSTIISETFLIQNRDCNLKFYTGDRNGLSPYLSLEYDSELQLPITATFRVVLNSTTTVDWSAISITERNPRVWHFNSEYEISDRRQLKFELIFTVDCSIGVDKSVQTPSYIDNYFLIDDVSQDFSKMFSDSSSHDLEFICGDESIKAHKSILCCRSDVFASMLHSDMVEGKTGRVNIQDMDANLFRQFLRCLYTGVLPTLTVDIAQQFYGAADKYNINPLKKQCADFLSDHLLPENAYDILILADQHNDPEFKRNVMDFMMKEQIPYSGEKWTEFCKENQALAIEVLNLFCQHLRPK